MRVLLVSTYELGHQPLHLASPAAALRAAGHEVRTLDTSVETWDDEALAWAGAVALSVPMHTAMRLALQVAAEVRRARPGMPVCLYGLYATVSRDLTLEGLADRVIAGEYEPQLVAWVDGLGTGAEGGAVVDLGRVAFRTPERDGLPDLERYAHLAIGDDHRLAGYVEASHGCLHRCRHCPVPVIYDGRIRIVAEDVVLADVEALAAAGAKHLTFGDPDFLNGPQHSLRVVRAVHRRFPGMTFDCTVKVEHILRHAHLWPEFAASGCLFVVSAFETVDDEVLARLDKGHTAAEAAEAVELLRGHGIEIRPSFLPFTPWTTLASILDLLDFVAAQDLVGNVDPVQYTIRLLIPEGSLLLDDSTISLGLYDPERLTYPWASPDPAVDRLQARLAQLVERSQAAGEALPTTYLRVRTAALEAASGREIPALVAAVAPGAGSTEGRPRLTEPWFC
jgi:radical SAM superfamily enzyme YgiQ (UPF0313 family)